MKKLIRAWDIKEWKQLKCPNCGRFRLNLCNNDKHLCEKCDWCPEMNGRPNDDSLDYEMGCYELIRQDL